MKLHRQLVAGVHQRWQAPLPHGVLDLGGRLHRLLVPARMARGVREEARYSEGRLCVGSVRLAAMM